MDWTNWCRLCGTDQIKNEFNIFTSLILDNISISEAVWKFFQIIIHEIDELPSKICQKCNDFLQDLIKFSITTSKVQEMFTEVQLNCKKNYQKSDLENVREKYGLMKEFNKNILIYDNDTVGKTASANESVNEKIDLYSTTIDLKLEKFTSDDENLVQNEHQELLHSLSIHDTKKKINDKCNNYCNIENEIEIRRRRKRKQIKNKNNLQKLKKEINFLCEICNKGFSRKCDHSLHMRKRHSILNTGFPCSYCGKVQKTKILLQDHLNKHHLTPGEQKPFICSHCNQKFITYHSHWSHMQTHKETKEKLEIFICDKCGKEFSSKKALRSHGISHIEERNYKCPNCPSSFKHSINLKLHMEIHGENYPCSICGIELATRANLRDHMICHSEEKKFKCNFCQKDFKRLKSLKTHLIIHIGIKPYECRFCKLQFVHNMELRRHLKSIHPIEFAKMIENGENISCGKFPTLQEFRAFNDQAALMHSNENLTEN